MIKNKKKRKQVKYSIERKEGKTVCRRKNNNKKDNL